MRRIDPANLDPERVIWSRLTDRERQIVTLVARGYSNYGIARRFRGTQNTVKRHIQAIYRKTGIEALGHDLNKRVALTNWFVAVEAEGWTAAA